MDDTTTTWGYRIVAHPDGEDTAYGLHEVSYQDGVPVHTMPLPLLISDTRDFMAVFRKLEDAVSRPLHDPLNPQPTPRSLSHVERAQGYPDGYDANMGYLPRAAESTVAPLTLAEIITHHRQWVVDLERMIAEQNLQGEALDKARSDIIMSLRIAKTLAPLEAHAGMAQQASTLIQAARDALYAVENSLNLQDGERGLFDPIHEDLENAGGLARSLSVAPGPDNCSACHGARGGAPGNENVVDGVVLCDWCSVDAAEAKRGKPEGANCWDPRGFTTPKADPA